MNEIIHGDSLEVLKGLEDESVDLVCTDPPYGYSFMGKSWDKTLPDIGIFKECLRVLKPGAFAFVMSAPRSDVCARMMIMLEDAGFEIGFTPIYWTYASGFPKAMNIGKMVDKRNGTERKQIANGKSGKNAGMQDLGPSGIKGGDYKITEGISPLEGSYGGFQPKPAVEVVIVAMKPLSEKTFVDQALKNGKGVTWLDDCRVPTSEDLNGGAYSGGERSDGEWKEQSGFKNDNLETFTQPQGRFPANLLVSDDVLNDGKDRPAAGNKYHVENEKAIFGGANGTNLRNTFGTVDSYSRYFDLDAWAKTLPFLIVPKASKGEKNRGLEGFKPTKTNDGRAKEIDNAFQRGSTLRNNHHPTVKPLKLMSYLITLGSREGDTVLEPFAGSGTTCVAAKQLNRNFIGIEREQEYVEIAKARLAAVEKPIQPTLNLAASQ